MKGDYPSALRLLQQAEKMDSFIDKLYYFLGQLIGKMENADLACQSFRESEKRGDKIQSPSPSCQ